MGCYNVNHNFFFTCIFRFMFFFCVFLYYKCKLSTSFVSFHQRAKLAKFSVVSLFIHVLVYTKLESEMLVNGSKLYFT